MKKSQLRNIIRESVKEALNEQPQPHAYVAVCNCEDWDIAANYCNQGANGPFGTNLQGAATGDIMCHMDSVINGGGVNNGNTNQCIKINTQGNSLTSQTRLVVSTLSGANTSGFAENCLLPPTTKCGIGCTDPNSQTYTPNASHPCNSSGYGPTSDPNLDNDCCGPAHIPGCTVPSALNYDPLATLDDGSCTYTGISIFGCECSVYDHILGSCPQSGGGSNYLTTNQATTIGGNPPVVGDTFRPYANTNFVVDSISTPNQPGAVNYSSGVPCDPPPGPTTYDCYPGQGCYQNWQGQGQYSGGTTAQNLAACEADCQTTYDCDGTPNYNCDPNYQGIGQYSGGTSAQNLTSCSSNCQPLPPINTYDCDQNYLGQGNAQCVVNTSGTGTYSGGTTGAQNYQACQAACQNIIMGCNDPLAVHCSQQPGILQNLPNCYDSNHEGCNGGPNDTSCCLYEARDRDIDRDIPDCTTDDPANAGINGCWICKSPQENTPPFQLCHQLTPTSGINYFNPTSGYNYYNTEAACHAAGPGCQKRAGDPIPYDDTTIGEGVNIKGKLLNKLRMSKLANIKKK